MGRRRPAIPLGSGPAAQAQAAPIGLPSAPQDLSATAGDSQVVLNWSAPANDGGIGIMHYEVRHAEGASVPGDTAWTSVGLATTHTVSGLTGGVVYKFELRAANALGSGPAAQAQATPIGLPSAPQDLSATAGDTQVVLNWSAPANDGGIGIVRYEVRHAEGASVPDDTAWTPVGLVTTRAVSGLTNGVLCAFEVRAVNGQGTSPAVQVQAEPRGNDAPVFDADATTFRLEETRGAFETRAKNVGRPVAAYDPEGERVAYDLEGADAQAFAIDANAQIRTKVGERYNYETRPRYTVTVRAQDESGARARKEVTIVLVDVDETPSAPQAPRVDPVSGDGKRLNVQWNAGTQDGVPPIVGYDVQYREARTPQWAAHQHAGAATATQISGLTPATRYEVRVRAKNEEGVSPWSAPGEGRTASVGHEPGLDAWLPRFGRTVAEQALEAIEGRMSAAAKPGIEARIAGQRIRGAAAGRPANGVELRDEGPSWSLSGRATEETDPDRWRAVSRAVTERELLTGSSFALTAATGGNGFASVWGRGTVSRFDGREGDLSLDGEVLGGMIGTDWMREQWSAGLIVAHSTAEGGYRRGEGVDGKVSATLTGLYPWARLALTDRVETWGAAGYGRGELAVTPERPDGEGAATLRTGLDVRMAAAGLSGMLFDGGTGRPALAAKTDAFVAQTASEPLRGSGAGSRAGGNLAATRATVTRLRLGLEGVLPVRIGGETVLTPSVEIGVRHDDGDAETGFGVDLGGGIAWKDLRHGISAELLGRGLLSHESGGFSMRGVSGSLSWDPEPSSDLGLSLTLTPAVGGSSSGGAEALLSRGTLAELAANGEAGSDDLRSLRLETGFGYGFAAFGNRFISTPEFRAGLSDAGRYYGLGWRLVRGESGPGSLELSLEALRRESVGPKSGTMAGARPEHEVGLRLKARW